MEEAHHQHTVDYHKGSGSRVESFRTSRYNLEYRKWGAHRLLGTLLLVQHRGWEQCPCTCAHSHWNSTSGLSCNQYRCCIPQSIFLQHHFPLRDRSDRERWNEVDRWNQGGLKIYRQFINHYTHIQCIYMKMYTCMHIRIVHVHVYVHRTQTCRHI